MFSFYAAVVAFHMPIDKIILNVASVALLDQLCVSRRVCPVVVVLCPSVCYVVVARPLSVVSSPAYSFRKRGPVFSFLVRGGRGLLSSSVVEGRQGLPLALAGTFSSLALVPLGWDLALPW